MKSVAAVIAVLLCAGTAHAHKPSDSYLALRQTGARIDGQWDIALRDLDYAIGLDANSDGAITWGELRAQHETIAAYALAHLQVAAEGGTPCRTRATEHLVDRHTDGAYAVLRFTVTCPEPPLSLDVRYSLFFDLDPQHRGVLTFDRDGVVGTALFSPDHQEETFDVAGLGARRSFAAFWRRGVWQTWLGFDHVVFLLALIIPTVLRRPAGAWHPTPTVRSAVTETVQIVAAFTLAHSLTLSLAGLGLIHLAPRVVTSGIAASLILAALNNAYPRFAGGRWGIAFGFGLFHGFSFADVFASSGTPQTRVPVALLGFNAGIETALLATVSALLLLTYVTRHSSYSRPVALVAGSSGVALLTGAWMLERLLAMPLP